MFSRSVLVVDDENTVRSVLADVVETFGYGCMTAADGYEALQLVQDKDFEIILSDIRMPKMDGLDLLKEIKEIRPDIPFIIITGFLKDYTPDAILNAGAVEFIEKPFKIDEIKTKLDRLFRELRLARENRRLLLEQEKVNKKFSAILKMSTSLTGKQDFDNLLNNIIADTTRIMEAERSSLYIIDWDKNELWTKIAQNTGRITVPMGRGISGKVAETGEVINVKDAWELPYFDRSYDIQNNFRTRSVICSPVCNTRGERIGVLQVLNKYGDNCFDKNDREILEAIASQIAITLENHFLITELQLSFESSIRTLSATVDARHPLTAGHSQRVTDYSLIVGKRMGLDNNDLEVIKYAALLHDIGKIGIRDDILLKQGKFTSEERQEMNEHPVRTMNILENFHFPRDLSRVPLIASQHHEKIDGNGYPNGLKGGQLPLASKILAVSDVFDALTSARDYPKYNKEKVMGQDPLPISKAVEILKEGSGSHFDADVVNCFIECIGDIIELCRGTHFSEEYIASFEIIPT